MTPAFGLAIHAERLHEDAVWRRLSDLLRTVERRGGHATVFVSALRAAVCRYDLTPRLRAIAEQGHEIGQHTHYYALAPAGAPVAFDKRTVLDPENVVRCLTLDHSVLVAAGTPPRGFVSGGWAIDSTVAAWLAATGFAYDTSRRAFRLAYHSAAAAAGDGCDTPALRADGLLDLPTTAPATRALRTALVRSSGAAGVGPARYDLAYLHDYDLLDGRRRLAAHALVRLRRVSVVARVLADRARGVLTAGAAHRGAA